MPVPKLTPQERKLEANIDKDIPLYISFSTYRPFDEVKKPMEELFKINAQLIHYRAFKFCLN